jgi:hypothetical protein
VKLVYVAGALSAPTEGERQSNINRAAIAAVHVAERAAMPVCPHTMTQALDGFGVVTDDFWYEGTAELLRRCDAVYVFDVEHVETSKGTRAEVDLANSLHLPVFIDLDSLRTWVAFEAKMDRDILEAIVGKELAANMPKRRFER